MEASARASRRLSLRSLVSRLSENPVIVKEMRSRMRGLRAFLLITIYLLLLSGLVSAIVFSFISLNTRPTITTDQTQDLGKTIFSVVIGLELCMVCFVAPALTASSIAAERERQTYDILRTTLLSARALVLGKLGSAMIYLVLLLVISFPLQAVAYLFGGVNLEELLIAFAILLVTGLALCSMSLFISSITQRVVSSTVISYVATGLIIFGLPILIYTVFILGMNMAFTSANAPPDQQRLVEIILLVIGWFIVSLNPIATAIVTEIIMLENQSFLSIDVPLSNGVSVLILSPWIMYLIFHLLLSLVFIWRSIRRVRRRER
mgnify:CR=1 FL=1